MSLRRRWAATLLPAAALAGALAWPSGPPPAEVAPSQVPAQLEPVRRPAPAPQRVAQVRPRPTGATVTPPAPAPVISAPAPEPTPPVPTASPVELPTPSPAPTTLRECVAGLLAADLDC